MKSVAHLVGLVLTLGAGMAGATTYTTYNATVDASDPNEVFFDTGRRLVASGSFEDLVVVSWNPPPTGGLASASIANIVTSGRNISFASVALYDNASGTGTAVPVDTSGELFFSDGLVSGTVFSVKLVGTASGANGGQYSMTGNVVPVPEPETYAMMLAGVVAVGFMAARRRRRN